MGKITTETIKLIRDHTARKQTPPLTLWEFDQLAYAWERWQALQKHAELTAASDAEAFHEYRNRPATGHPDGFTIEGSALEHAFYAGIAHARSKEPQ